MCGGAEGIRTLETVSRLHTFQACAFDHSATAPLTRLTERAGGLQVETRSPPQLSCKDCLTLARNLFP